MQKIKTFKNLRDVLNDLGIVVFQTITKKELNDEEKAFYIGMLNVCASLTEAEDGENSVSLNYEKVKTDFEDAYECYLEHKQSKQNSTCHQMSLEELYPEIFKAIDEKIKNALKNNKE